MVSELLYGVLCAVVVAAPFVFITLLLHEIFLG